MHDGIVDTLVSASGHQCRGNRPRYSRIQLSESFLRCFRSVGILKASGRGRLATTREQLVSSDIVGDAHMAIVDLSLTTVVDGDLCSGYSWYDNEFGYTNPLVEVARYANVTV